MPLFAVTHLKLKKKSSPKSIISLRRRQKGGNGGQSWVFCISLFLSSTEIQWSALFQQKGLLLLFITNLETFYVLSLKGKKRRRQRDGLFLYLGAPEKKRETWTVVSSLEYLTPVHHQPLSFFFLKLYFVSLGLCFFFFLAGSFLSRKK